MLLYLSDCLAAHYPLPMSQDGLEISHVITQIGFSFLRRLPSLLIDVQCLGGYWHDTLVLHLTSPRGGHSDSPHPARFKVLKCYQISFCSHSAMCGIGGNAFPPFCAPIFSPVALGSTAYTHISHKVCQGFEKSLQPLLHSLQRVYT